jgi:hypothetical protein
MTHPQTQPLRPTEVFEFETVGSCKEERQGHTPWHALRRVSSFGERQKVIDVYR